MNFLHTVIGMSLFAPFFVGSHLGKDFSGIDFPLFFGLSVQAIVGNFILVYVRGDEVREKLKIFTGYLLFFTGLSGSYLAGKTVWLPVFWEVSTIGAVLIYFGQGFHEKAIKSILSLFLASGASMIFISAWVFLPEGKTGYSFLMIGLLIKSTFSLFHMWYPEAHTGTPSHASASYSGIMLNLPLLLFVRYVMVWWNEIPFSHLLIPIAGLGVFLGGLTAFFSRDVKKALAYSTIEKSNFMALFLFVSALWLKSEVDEYASLSRSFLVLFYLMLLHHSVSKSFQFLAIGYISKKAKTTVIDLCRGVGRLSGLSSIKLGIGTMSFAAIPGTAGFIAEATLLFLISKTIDLSNVDDSVYFLLAIVFSLSGMVLGAAAHIRMYLPMVLSMPDPKIAKQIESENEPVASGISISLQLLGVLIFLIPVLLFFPLFVMNRYINCSASSAYECVNILSGNGAILANWIPPYLLLWLYKLTIISFGVTLLFISLAIFRWSHRIEKRRGWDCGNNYGGAELSIPSSVISDPLYNSVGRYFISKKGELYFDSAVNKVLLSSLDFGKFWINKVESGEIGYYLLFSAFSFLISLFLILVLKIHL
ncbi:MAG: formate hydrogenase [Leptospiraceae bacterium]|nr:formate hydrogenase [Leptospiraceae bacterium]